MSTSVITPVAGRLDHLARVVQGLARSRRPAGELVVVAMDEATHAAASELAASTTSLSVRVVALPAGDPDAGLPLARARNAGAAASRGDTLVFLDVDCIPDRDLVGAYTAAAVHGDVVNGPVRWLVRHWAVGLDEHAPGVDRELHARSDADLTRGVLSDDDLPHVDERHELLWSLAVGMRRDVFERIGGFDEGYEGYGAEDTDLGLRARRAGVAMRWIPTGTAFHQWHPSADPPTPHAGSIVVNARRYHQLWGRWPMEGWLAAFAEAGLVRWAPDGDELELADHPPAPPTPRVVSIPSTHPYTRAVCPSTLEVAADPTEPWWPHPGLDDAAIADLTRGTVVHVHFGFDHRSPAELERWAAAVGQAGAALVVTVHDLHSPHEPDPEVHDRRLAALLGHADQVLTLTEPAAAEVRRRWGRDATVVAHPRLAPLGGWTPPPDRRPMVGPPAPVVGCLFKGFRRGMLGPEVVVPPLLAATREAGARLAVHAHADADPERLVALHGACGTGVEPTLHARLSDAELLDALTRLDVVVLPYAQASHSGLVELARDLGVRVVTPDVPTLRAQCAEIVPFRLDASGGDGLDLRTATLEALRLGRPAPPDPIERRQQLRDAQRTHLAAYQAAAESAGTR